MRFRPVLRWLALALTTLPLGCSYDFDGAIRCDNGSQDGDETGVDCGGSCVAGNEGRCSYGEGCKAATDCAFEASCQAELCTPKKLTAFWRKLDTKENLKPRFGAGLSFFESEGVLIGGYHKVKNGPPAESLADSWVFDGSWVPDTMEAPGRHYHAQAYDKTLSRVVIAGGYRQGVDPNRLRDTWARDANSKWTKLDDLPETRVSAAMVYDEPRSRTLFYGEGNANEIWVLESKAGALWQRLKTTNAPEVPFRHAMAYDAERDRVVVFGGLTDSSYQPNQRTSILDPVTRKWDFKAYSQGPRARWGAGMAYDSDRKRVVLFAGRASQGRSSSAYNDVWDWDGEGWTQVAPLAGRPLPPRSFHPAFAYDAERRQMVALIGGTAGFVAVNPAQTWAMAVLGWPCASDLECGEGTFCVDRLCCNSRCKDGVCNDRDNPGVCTKPP